MATKVMTEVRTRKKSAVRKSDQPGDGWPELRRWRPWREFRIAFWGGQAELACERIKDRTADEVTSMILPLPLRFLIPVDSKEERFVYRASVYK